jgi:hypothetical protein
MQAFPPESAAGRLGTSMAPANNQSSLHNRTLSTYMSVVPKVASVRASTGPKHTHTIFAPHCSLPLGKASAAHTFTHCLEDQLSKVEQDIATPTQSHVGWQIYNPESLPFPQHTSL